MINNNNLTNNENVDNQIQDMSNLEKGVVVAFSFPVLIKSILIFLICTFFFIISAVSFLHSFEYIQTIATVVDLEYNESDNVYYPIYEYEYNSKMVRAKGFPQSDVSKIIIGEKEEIQYDPNNYENFDFGSRKIGIFIFGISLLFLIVSIRQTIIIIKMYKAFIREKREKSIHQE